MLRDEVRHRDFGWLLLDWLLVTPHADAVRRVLEHDLAERYRACYRRYVPVVPRDRTLTEAEVAWGLLPEEGYAEVMARCGTWYRGSRSGGSCWTCRRRWGGSERSLVEPSATPARGA